MAKRGTLEHPKNKRLARKIGTAPWASLGLLEAIWHWVGRYRPTGILTDEDLLDLADSVGFVGSLVEVLEPTGWLDKVDDTWYIHDWHEHADDSVRKVLAKRKEVFGNGDATRKTNDSRTVLSIVESDSRTVTESVEPEERTDNESFANDSRIDREQDTNDSRTILDKPKPKPKPKPEINLASEAAVDLEFLEFWRFYPKRSGDSKRKIALLRFKSARKRVSFEQLMEGVKRYSRFCDATGKTGTELVQQASTWLSGEAWSESFECPEEPPPQVQKPIQGVDFYIIDGGYTYRDDDGNEVSEEYAANNPETVRRYKTRPKKYVLGSDPPELFDESAWLREMERVGAR